MQSRGRRGSKRGDQRERWQRLVERWAKSGLSQAEFCRRHSLWASDFSVWKRRLRGDRPARKARREAGRQARKPLRWLPVEVRTRRAGGADGRAESMDRPGRVAVVLRNGREIHLGEGFDPERLVQLVEILETAGC